MCVRDYGGNYAVVDCDGHAHVYVFMNANAFRGKA